MQTVIGLFGAWLVIAAINVVPAFMPPTWLVLVAIRFEWDLPVVPLVVGGSVAATIGRVALGQLVGVLGTSIVPRRMRDDLSALAATLNRQQRWTCFSVFGLTLLTPLPSNELFIAAGLARLRLAPIGWGFLASRLVQYGVAVIGAGEARETLQALLSPRLADPESIVLTIAGLLPAILIAFVPWSRLLGRFDGTRTG